MTTYIEAQSIPSYECTAEDSENEMVDITISIPKANMSEFQFRLIELMKEMGFD